MSVTTTPIPIIPTLDVQSILDDPRDILAYILRYYVTAPKSVSNSTPAAMISFADTASRYQSDSNVLSSAIIKDLSSVYGRFFDLNATTIDVSTQDNGNGTYNVTILLATIKNNTSYTLGASISVDNTGAINIKYHPNLS